MALKQQSIRSTKIQHGCLLFRGLDYVVYNRLNVKGLYRIPSECLFRKKHENKTNAFLTWNLLSNYFTRLLPNYFRTMHFIYDRAVLFHEIVSSTDLHL